MFGGNSNWRGPVWFPVNLVIIRALLQHYSYYGNDFTIECPTGSGVEMTLFEVAKELSDRLIGTFVPDGDGTRPVYGTPNRSHSDEHWNDLVLFYEYFDGDTGAGLGASHQTGWTGPGRPTHPDVRRHRRRDAFPRRRLGPRPPVSAARRRTDR